jgi:photosystem II stability/assembly factor-like uncharacterized protein
MMNRARILMFAVGIGLSGLQPCKAATGVLALDQAAVPVLAPARAMLDVVVVNAGRLFAGGEHGLIITSADNGQSWQQAAVPVDVTITAVGFANARDGWAAGNSGVILHTSDGGATWQLQMDGFRAGRLTLAGATAAVAQKSTALGAPLAMVRAQRLDQKQIPFLTILPISAARVIVFGAYRMAMASDDGGKTWTDWSLHIGDALSHHLYGVAVTPDGIYLTGEAGSVFRSTDGGVNFLAVSLAGSATLFGITGTGDGGLLAYGVAGLLFRSTDSGKSWQQVPFPEPSNITDATTLASGAIVLTAQSGVLYESTDHGKNFFALPNRVPMAAYAVSQAPDGTLIVAGSSGIIAVPQ